MTDIYWAQKLLSWRDFLQSSLCRACLMQQQFTDSVHFCIFLVFWLTKKRWEFEGKTHLFMAMKCECFFFFLFVNWHRHLFGHFVTHIDWFSRRMHVKRRQTLESTTRSFFCSLCHFHSWFQIMNCIFLELIFDVLLFINVVYVTLNLKPWISRPFNVQCMCSTWSGSIFRSTITPTNTTLFNQNQKWIAWDWFFFASFVVPLQVSSLIHWMCHWNEAINESFIIEMIASGQ